MKKIIVTMSAIALCMLIIGGCLTVIKPGYVGVVVSNFSGVQEKELTVGYHMIAPWKDVYTFPTFEQNHTWDKQHTFVFQTCEGLGISAEMGVTFHVKEDRIHTLFAKYRRGLDEISNTFLYNYVRDAVNKHASTKRIEDLYGPEKETFLREVEESVRHDMQEYGLVISRIYLMGNFHMPQSVIQALNDKIAAIQRAQQRENELKESEAEARKQIAQAHGKAEATIEAARADAESQLQKARAQATAEILVGEAKAKANDAIKRSLNGDIIRYEMAQRWDGKLPQVAGHEGIMLFKDWDK